MTSALRTQIAALVQGRPIKDFASRMALQVSVIRTLAPAYHTELEATVDIAPVFAELTTGATR